MLGEVEYDRRVGALAAVAGAAVPADQRRVVGVAHRNRGHHIVEVPWNHHAAQLLIIATPIWMGQPSSVCKMVLERLDAELSEKDDQGRLPNYGKVAGVAVLGNEDGAHHVIAEVFQALNDVGFTVSATASTFWVGEAMGSLDYRDAGPKPDTTRISDQDLRRQRRRPGPAPRRSLLPGGLTKPADEPGTVGVTPAGPGANSAERR
jgi:hypothetical protein